MKKTSGDVIILHKCTKNHDHVSLPEIWHVTDVIFIFQFGLFFALLTPLKPWKIKIKKKKWKNCPGDIIILHMCTINYDHVWCTVPEIWCVTDRQTDGWKKWHIEVGAPPKKWYPSSYVDSTHFILHLPMEPISSLTQWAVTFPKSTMETLL